MLENFRYNFFCTAKTNHCKIKNGVGFMKKYANLDGLLADSETAKIFFSSLPDYVQGAVMKIGSTIFTEDELHRCAERVMHEFN